MLLNRLVCVIITIIFTFSTFAVVTANRDVPDSHNMALQDLLKYMKNNGKAAVSGKWSCGTPYFYGDGAKWFKGPPGPIPTAFQLKKTGTHCKIYVDDTASPYPSDPELDNALTQFDTVIWARDTATFGDPGLASTNIMIETMDGPYGVGGYYSGGDQIYVDCADLGTWGYEIIAHEFQHLIHGYIKGGGVLWMNEGCSMYAIYVCYPSSGTLDSYVDAHKSDPNQDLTSFSNSMNDYGSCYVWVRYLADCYGGNATIKAYVADSYSGIQGIDHILTSYGKTFEGIFPDWTMASYLDDRSIDKGEFGYNGLAIQMAAQGTHSFPWTGGSTVDRWASEYHIVSSSSPTDTKVVFTGGADKATCIVTAIGKPGKQTTVYRMALDTGGIATTYVMGLGSNYSDLILVADGLSNGGSYNWDVSQYTPDTNSPPTKPAIPSGPGTGDLSKTYNYSSIATDPDGDQVSYIFDWGDGKTTNTIYYLSGTGTNESHSWTSRGTFNIRVRASDCKGALSPWSDTLPMNIQNTPPATPVAPSGPAMGVVGQNYSYFATSIDPESDKIKYTFDWGDGTTTDSALVASGTGASIEHTWNATGTYPVSVLATDELGALSPWSNALDVKINPNNTAPNTPAAISGPITGVAGTTYTYSTIIIDPESDKVKCIFDWDDGTNTTTALQSSGTTISADHAWTSPDTYHIRAMAIDAKGANSSWCTALAVTINARNNPPDIPPAPSGPVSGTVGNLYTYSTTVTDPDGNTVKCLFDWGDGTNTSTVFKPSGSTAQASHSWAAVGVYQVRAMAIDDKGNFSSFSTPLSVTISENNQATCSVSGRVIDGVAVPVSGATVTLYLNGSSLRTQISATDGSYSISNLMPGDYEIEAEKSGYTKSGRVSFSLVKDEVKTGIDLTIYVTQVGKGTVQVVVKDSSGTPVSDASVFVNISGGDSLSDATDSSGIVVFPNLEPDTYTVEVAKNGYQSWQNSDVAVVANETTTVDVSLKKVSSGGGGGGNNTNETGGSLSFLKSNTFLMILLVVILLSVVLLAAAVASRKSKKKGKARELEGPVFYPYPPTHSLQNHLSQQVYNVPQSRQTWPPPPGHRTQMPSHFSSPQQYPTATPAPNGVVPGAGSGNDVKEQENRPNVMFCKKCGLANENPGESCARCGEIL